MPPPLGAPMETCMVLPHILSFKRHTYMVLRPINALMISVFSRNALKQKMHILLKSTYMVFTCICFRSEPDKARPWHAAGDLPGSFRQVFVQDLYFGVLMAGTDKYPIMAYDGRDRQ